jgi:hypothetical protein
MNHAQKDKLNHIQKNFSRTNEFLNYKSNNLGEDTADSTIKKQERRVEQINSLIDKE